MLMLHILARPRRIGVMKKILLVSAMVIAALPGMNCYAAMNDLPVHDGDSNCYDLEVVYARGSGGEYENTREYYELKAASESIFATHGYTVRFSDLDYPAPDMSSPLRMLRAYVSAGKAYEFGRAVRQGVQGLRAHYKNISRRCPDTGWILMGYSQGAMVMAEASKTFRSEHVEHVVLFGDPETYLPEGYGLFPDACFRRNYSTWRRYVGNCRTSEGVFGARIPYEPENMHGKFSLFCESDDYICGSSHNPLRNGGHTRYVEYMQGNMKALFAEFIKKSGGLTPNPYAVTSSVQLTAAELPANVIKMEKYDDKIRLRWDAAAVDSKYLLIRLNRLDLGYIETLAGEIEITDVDWSEDNDVSVLAMAEDGELGEAVLVEVAADERAIVLSPVEPGVSSSTASPDEPVALEEPVVPEPSDEVSEPDAAPAQTDSVDESDDVSNTGPPSPQNAGEPLAPIPDSSEFINGLAKIKSRKGFSFLSGFDIAKIMLAVMSAAAVLIVFLVRRK